MEYLAFENIKSTNTGGYFARGGGGNGTRSTGAIRFKNITLDNHAGCGSACAEKNNRAILFRVWGYYNGFEILDSEFDANVAAVPAGAPEKGVSGVMLLHCMRDVTVRNNSFRDYKEALRLSPGEWGCDLLPRSLDNIVFDRNTVIATTAMNRTFGGSGVIITHSGSNLKTLEDLEVTNNFFSSPDGGLASCLDYKGGNDDGPNPGTIKFSNNTCHGDLLLARGGVDIGNARTFKHENWILENNIIGGQGSGDFAVRTKYNPLNWQARANSYSPSSGFQWNNSSLLTLAQFKSQSQADTGSSACEASLENPAASDLHLRATDTCAIDQGVTNGSFIDIDGQARSSSDPWDRGADELGGSSGPGSGQTLLQLQSPADKECVSQSSVQVAGYADDPSGVVGVVVNGVQALLTPAPTAHSANRVSYEALVPLGAGANALDVTMSTAGGTTSSVDSTVYRELGPPLLSWSSSIDPNNALVGLVQGTVDDESGIQSLTVNGAAVSLQSSFSGGQSFNHSISLVQGSNPITVRATDVCQNVTTESDTLQVSGNSGPTVNAQTVSTSEEAPVSIQLSGSDPDGDPLTFEIVAPPTNGILSGVPPSLSYLPNPDFFGTDQLRFRATDGQTYSSAATVQIQVANVNDTPVIRPDAYVVTVDVPLTVPAPGVVANDHDVDGDTLTVALSTPPSQGSLTLDPSGGFSYVPNAGFTGSDFFQYRAQDGNGGVATARVDLTVQGSSSGSVKVDLGADVTLIDGAPLVRTGTFSGASGSPSATVDYGDGAGAKPLTLREGRFDLSHTYAKEGVYLVVVCVSSSGGSGCGSLRVANQLSTQLTLNTSSVEISSGLYVEAVLTDSLGRRVVGAPLSMVSNVGCSANGVTDGLGTAVLGCVGAVSGGGLVQVTVSYDASDRDTLAPSSRTQQILVSPDTAIIVPSAANLSYIRIPGKRKTSRKVDFVMEITPRLDGDNLMAALANADVRAEVIPMSSGTRSAKGCAKRLDGSGIDASLRVTCSFEALEPDTYWLKTDVSGTLTGLHYESFVVAHPDLRLNTGGGSFIWPDSDDPTTGYPGDRATYAFTSDPSASGGGPSPSLVVVRTYADGSMARFRSTAFDIDRSFRSGGARTLQLRGDGEHWDRGAPSSKSGRFDLVAKDYSGNGSRDAVWVQVRDTKNDPHRDLGFESPVSENFEVIKTGNNVLP